MRRAARLWQIAVTVEGLNIGRFLRQAGEAGIQLTALRRSSPKKVTVLLREEQLPALQEIALRGGWMLTTGNRQGAGRCAEWLHRRWLLAAAALCAGIALLAASRVMWCIDVVDGGAYAADIRMALTEMGVTAPMLRAQVAAGDIRDALEWRYPRIAWFEVGWRGTTLVVRAVEGVLPRADGGPDGACDVVAARDGVIHSIVTRAGTPVVKQGDIVRQGEVLIKGEERTSDGAVKPVAARGSVTARVWEGAVVNLPAAETVTAYTGREQRISTIRTPFFDLWKLPECEYAQYDTAVSEMPFGGIFIPLTLRTETRMEAEITTHARKWEDLQAEAAAAATRRLHEKAAEGESFIDIWGNCSMIEDEKVQAYAIGEKLVEIGLRAPASGMAAPAGEDSHDQPR